MNRKNRWLTFVMFRQRDQDYADRLICDAGYSSKSSWHANKEEACEAAKEMLRRLLDIDASVDCVACYVEPWQGIGSGLNNTPFRIYPRNSVIQS